MWIISKKNFAGAALALGLASALALGGTTANALDEVEPPADDMVLTEEQSLDPSTENGSDEGLDTEGSTEEKLPAVTEEDSPAADGQNKVVEQIPQTPEGLATNAPEFTAELLPNPNRLVISNISVPGTSWDLIDSCGYNFNFAGWGGSSGPLKGPGPHSWEVGEDATSAVIDFSCILKAGGYTAETSKTVSLQTSNENGAGSNNGGNAPGDGGNAPGDPVLSVGTSKTQIDTARDALAATGGTQSLALGAAAAGMAVLGAGLLLARRFAKRA